MEKKSRDKTRLLIYILVAYGVTYLMGLLMWYGKAKGYDVSVFPMAQMMYPAAGVILGLLITNKGEKQLPLLFFVTFLISNFILIVMSIISVIAPSDDLKMNGVTFPIYNLIAQYIIMFFSIVAFILLMVDGKKKRADVGLTRRNWKCSIIIVIVFVLIYLARIFISTGAAGIAEGSGLKYLLEWFGIFKNPTVLVSILMLPLNYILTLLMFFGEEYGWRYYLQPLLQKKFGLRIGIIVLGVVWGFWHLPLDLFYYTDSTQIQMFIAQIITCIFLGIFLGYSYMKTQNIWVPICIHFLNKNLIPIITATFTSDVLENKSVGWGDIPASLLINGLCFGFFLLSDVFKKKKEAVNSSDLQY